MKLYNSRRWRKLRAAQLAAHPLCKMCNDLGKVTPATVCDHIKPHKGNVELFWSGPFQSLCKECHDRHKKMEEMGGAMGCDADGLPIDANHLWNMEQ